MSDATPGEWRFSNRNWRAVMDRGSGGYEMPRVVRLNVEGGRCGGGWRRPAHRGEC